ncbi:MAG: pyruvate kinase, partial [Clostridia bacterium]|nr:pyruvate kinase [Clostridia bacterium]
MTKTKIVCTIGPASRSEEVLRGMVEAGMRIARLNFSHGTHGEHRETIDLLRSLNRTTGQQVAILGDLQGPKIRLGVFTDKKVQLETGQTFHLTTVKKLGNQEEAFVDYSEITRDVTVGAKVLMNDGLVQGQVKEVGNDFLRLKIVAGGPVGDHKGVNLPGTRVGLPALTEKDKVDLAFILEQGLDYLACSFVREAGHMVQVRELAGKGNKPALLAKIETQEAITNLHDIIMVSDGIMVARGDLAVEVPLEMVPIIQKVALKLCHEHGKFSITATQ